MLIVELQSNDFDKAEGFVKIGMVASAIANAKGASNLLDSERKVFPRINEAVQLGKLRPLDSETLRPLPINDYGSGIVPFASLVEWGQATKLFDFRREQYTIKHVDGESTMNPAAHEEYQRALESRRAKGRYSLDEAAQYVANNSNANAKSIYTKLEKSAETGELTIHWPGSDEVYKPKPRDQLSMLRMRGCGVRGVEEAYWDKLNDWLEKNEPRLGWKFPKPDAPTAKAKSVADTTPSDDWREKARTIADECFDHDTELNCRDSLKGYSKRVMELMQQRGIKGSRGIIDNSNYVMRDALQSNLWWKNKNK